MRLMVGHGIDVRLRSLDLSQQHANAPRKEFGFVEGPPYRSNQYDALSSHMVPMQDPHLASNNDMRMDAYPQDHGLHYPMNVSPSSTYNGVDSNHNVHHLVQDMNLPNGHRLSPLDATSSPNSKTTDQSPGLSSDTTGSLPGMNRSKPIIHQQGQPSRPPVTLPSNGKDSYPKTKDTLKLTAQTPQELTSAMTANILERLDPSKYNKADLELAVRTSVLNLLGEEKTNKKRPHEEISPPRASTSRGEKSFPCHYCPKTKSTQCELT